MRLDAIDWEIERLRAQRQRVAALLRDPDESKKRRGRRGIALGRWVQTLELTPEQMKQMRALADEEDRWLCGDTTSAHVTDEAGCGVCDVRRYFRCLSMVVPLASSGRIST